MKKSGRNRVERAWLCLAFIVVLTACAKERSGPFDIPAAAPPVADMSSLNASEVRAAAEISASKIHFAFDKWDLRPESMGTLERIAGLLRENPSLKMRIGGHCDERGSVEYNYVLGERRARAAYGVLVSKGVNPEQLEMYSYSKLAPFVPGKNEAAHAKNRRDEFAVMSFCQ